MIDKAVRYGVLQGPGINRDSFLELYKRHELVHVKNASDVASDLDLVGHLRHLYSKFPAELEETFNFETIWGGGLVSHKDDKLEEPEDLNHFFSKSSGFPDSFYVSVIVQDNPQLLQDFFEPLPFWEPEFLGIFHDHCVWFFLGQAKKNDGEGRNEHRDFIEAAGSWHLQLQSTKIWHVRRKAEDEALTIAVEPGDMIFINTRVWLHRTVLQRNESSLNASYARDFWIDKEAFQKLQGNGKKSDKTNLENPWARGNVRAGEAIYTEPARFIVYDVDALATSFLCQECHRPAVDLQTVKRMSEGQLSRFELIQTGLRTSTPLVDPNTCQLYCSTACHAISKEQLFVSAHSSDAWKNKLYYCLLRSGHFEVLSLTCSAFLQQYRPDDCLLQMSEEQEAEVAEHENVYVMHEATTDELPLKLSPRLDVVETSISTVCKGMRATKFSGVALDSKESLQLLVQQANAQRQSLSANVTGMNEFDWTWTGVDLEFDGPLQTDDEQLSTRKWVDRAFEILSSAGRIRGEDVETEKRRFEKLERLFRFNLRRVAKTDLLGFYPTVSRIPVGNASQANCKLLFGEGPNRPARVIAIRDIKEGSDFVLASEDEEDVEDVEEEQTQAQAEEAEGRVDLQPTKRARMST